MFSLPKFFTEMFSNTPAIKEPTPFEAMVAAIHVVSETGKCMNDNNLLCVYYNEENGKRCIIGEFFNQMGLPECNAEMNICLLSQSQNHKVHFEFLREYNIVTLEKLQTVHDDLYGENDDDPEEFIRDCMKILEENDLK